MKPVQQNQELIFVVDDDEAVLDSIRLRFLAEGLKGAYFNDAESLLAEIADGKRPVCIVTDIRLPGVSGLDLQRSLADMAVRTPLILITGHGEIDMAVRAVKEGAFDFLQKPFDPNRLIGAVRKAMRAAHLQLETERSLLDLRDRVAQLSERQRQVMDLAVLGRSNKEIAQQMGISPRTVESYRAWVMEKTGAGNLAELVRIAMRLDAS